ncbi:MAG: Asparagine-tRNA ligase [Berkelbacteria bacterium GW2011_GWA1_36_9]|uniref:Asparagine-tRNA ligase n=1 Tax=Berkelbacteria bacterium GW2011_GWA1_36_9 TaxID=1618331 RepID=A0A0G0FXP0_9BACT|nr:MAG: Asparagine-tRNA ligase [Berkelbacteria bacterium GW2011_GWA1_36_9]
MNVGPYRTNKNNLSYIGNKLFSPIKEVRNIEPCILDKRHIEIKNHKKWEALIKIWDGTFKASNKFMEKQGALLFDLPITTRMISSPGALTGTIMSDVDPFKIEFFNKKTFLTQSSQLYLEFAITNPEISSVYCWEKSFRREKADFRHLPEFTHIEFESNLCFEKNLIIQQEYVKFLISYLINNYKKELAVFLHKKDINELKSIAHMKNFERISFHKAFELLKKKTGLAKYDNPTIKNFSAYEEVLLCKIVGKPVFVTNYINEEVAFYHANHPQKKDLAINADLLFPGYGEIIGSGERVHTREETEGKAKHFKLDMDDYFPYIESRGEKDPKIHSGWGMGIERFIQSLLKIPFIWEAKVFPRVHNQNKP